MVSHTHGLIPYYTYREDPSVVVLSGMHGNEYESGAILKSWLDDIHTRLPAFLFIPEVSPSAVKLGTRKNAEGHDINRMFFDETKDLEARAVMDIVRPHHFKICIDVHEDPDRTLAFYLYDSAYMNETEQQRYREAVQTTGARLYTGIDDLEDELLGCHIERGYYSFRPEWIPEDTDVEGFSSKWMIQKKVTQRFFTLEIPGKAATSLKQSLVTTVVPYLLKTYGVQ